MAGLDPDTREIVRLFHPRRDSWADHFVWDGPELKARTQMGRVTIAELVINDLEIVAVRSVTRRGSFVALATRTEPRFPSAYSGGAGRRVAAIMRRGSDLPTCHCLLLDRRDRQAYVSERDQAMILFAVMEPEEGDAHNVLVDGMLMSPGGEDHNLPPATEPVDQFRRFLDTQVQVSEGG